MQRRYGFAAVLIAAGVQVQAEVIDEPLQLSNRQPFVQLFNLPPMRSAEVLPAAATEWRGAIDVANNFVREHRDDEQLFFDGESQRYELSARYGIGHNVELGVSVPWISCNGGALDGFIDDWHRWWGLPRGGRPDFRSHQVAFNYQRDGHTEFNFANAESGFGDVQISAAWQWIKSSQNAVALSGYINLPTGDVDKLTGTGKTSAGFSVAATHDRLFDLPLALSANIGAQYLPRVDVLREEQKQYAWFADTEINWVVAQDWRLKAQLQTHSAIYDSGLRALGTNPVQLLLGGSVKLSPHWMLDTAVGEDVLVDTAPDVTLQLALRAIY
ncbi:MAG: hypothetical protein JWM78_125 [Verrucomicrobiaceae bacterium]|nr:hypothetical protein [Verrucomicrobiaceae bacterium]